MGFGMDIGVVATAFVGAKTQEAQLAIAAEMLRMNAEAAASVAKIIDAVQASMDRFVNVPAGVGENLDVSV
jgi:hypothetical protein